MQFYRFQAGLQAAWAAMPGQDCSQGQGAGGNHSGQRGTGTDIIERGKVWCSEHSAPHFRNQCIKVRGTKEMVCKPTKPCANAPPAWHFAPDLAVKMMASQMLGIFGRTARGTFDKNLYVECYDLCWKALPPGLPPPYTGHFPPSQVFLSGSRQPVVMWPESNSSTSLMWPQNGGLDNAEFKPEYTDFFGLEWRNVWVYYGT